MILDTAVHAQTTRRHRLETLGHVLHRRFHNLPLAFRLPDHRMSVLRAVDQLADNTNAVVHGFRILCSLSAVKVASRYRQLAAISS